LSRLVFPSAEASHKSFIVESFPGASGALPDAPNGEWACIGGDQAFYRDLGFKRACALEYWKRSW
jgi:hypothetical protein